MNFLQHVGDPPKLLLNDTGGLDSVASSPPRTLAQLCTLLNKEWRPRDSGEQPADSHVEPCQQSDDVEKLLQSGELDKVRCGVSMVSKASSPEGTVLTRLCEVAAGRCLPPQLRVHCLRTLWAAMNNVEAGALRHIMATRDGAAVHDKMSAYGLIVRCLSLKETLNTPEAVSYCSQILAAVNLYVLLRHVTNHAEAVARQDAADQDSHAPLDSGMSEASSVSAARAHQLLCQLHGARQCINDLSAANIQVSIEERIRAAAKPTRGVTDWLATSSQSKLPRVVVHALLANDWISTVAVLLTSPSMARNVAAHHALAAVVRSIVCQLLRHPEGVLVFTSQSTETLRLVAALKHGHGHAHGGACLQWCLSAAHPRASGADVARILEAYAQAMAAVLMLKQPHVVCHNPGPLSSSHMAALQHLSQLMVTAAGRDAVATVVSWFAFADLERVLQASWHPRGVIPQHAVDILLCAVRDAREEVVWCRILQDRVEIEVGASDESKAEDKSEDKCGSVGAKADVSASADKAQHVDKTGTEGLLNSVLVLLDGAAKPGGTQRTSRTLLQARNTCCFCPARPRPNFPNTDP